jgi:hypothetical protein
MDFEATEDPLRNLNDVKPHEEDDQDEQGPGVDYRQILKL